MKRYYLNEEIKDYEDEVAEERLRQHAEYLADRIKKDQEESSIFNSYNLFAAFIVLGALRFFGVL
jgi:hypothetical protein